MLVKLLGHARVRIMPSAIASCAHAVSWSSVQANTSRWKSSIGPSGHSIGLGTSGQGSSIKRCGEWRRWTNDWEEFWRSSLPEWARILKLQDIRKGTVRLDWLSLYLQGWVVAETE